MTEHWKTKEKRLAQEALSQVAGGTVAPVASVTPKGTQYRVFSKRMDIVAQVYSLEEAEAEASKVGGTYIIL